MLVRNLQGFLRSLQEPLTHTGCPPKALQEIERTCKALDAFAEMDFEQLATLLELADEHRRTGVMPDLNDPFRQLARGLATPETTVDQFGQLLDSLNLKKVTPEAMRAFGKRVHDGFDSASKDKKTLLKEVLQAFVERKDPATARQQRLERLTPIIQRIRELETAATTPESKTPDLKKGLKAFNLPKQKRSDLLFIVSELGLSVEQSADVKQLAAAIDQVVLRHKAKKPAEKKTPAPVDAALVARFVQQVREIEERAAAPETTVDQLLGLLEGVDLASLDKDHLLAIAKDLDVIADRDLTKDQMIEKIRQVSLTRKEAEDFQRV